MRTRTLTALVAVVLATGSAACQGNEGPGRPTAPPLSPSPAAASPTPAGPVAEIISVLQVLRTTTYRYSRRNSAVARQGEVDPVAQTAVATDDAFLPGIAILTPGAYFLKINGSWKHLDPAKVGSLRNLGLYRPDDPEGFTAYGHMIVEAERVDDRTFRGVIDLTQSLIGFRNFGDLVARTDFDLAVDAQNRPVKLVLHVPPWDGEDATMTYTFTDFGANISPDLPEPGSVAEADQVTYKLLAY